MPITIELATLTEISDGDVLPKDRVLDGDLFEMLAVIECRTIGRIFPDSGRDEPIAASFAVVIDAAFCNGRAWLSDCGVRSWGSVTPRLTLPFSPSCTLQGLDGSNVLVGFRSVMRRK